MAVLGGQQRFSEATPVDLAPLISDTGSGMKFSSRIAGQGLAAPEGVDLILNTCAHG